MLPCALDCYVEIAIASLPVIAILMLFRYYQLTSNTLKDIISQTE